MEKSPLNMEKAGLYEDFPLCGLMALIIAVFIFTHNSNSYNLGAVVAVAVLASIFIKGRFSISSTSEWGISLVVLAVFAVLGYSSVSLKTLSVGASEGYISYFLAVALCALILVKVYKMKNRDDFYYAYFFSFFMIFISSLFAPWKFEFGNLILFLFYAVFSMLFFMDLIVISYPAVKSTGVFEKYRALPLILSIALTVGGLSIAGQKMNIEATKMLARYGNIAGSIFGNSTILGTNNSIYQSKKEVMRIFTDGNVTNVKARIYNHYKMGKWDVVVPKKEEIFPLPSPLPGVVLSILGGGGPSVFSLLKKDDIAGVSSSSCVVQRHLIFDNKNRVYEPAGMIFVAAQTDKILRDSLGNVDSSDNSLKEYWAVSRETRVAEERNFYSPPSAEDLAVSPEMLPEVKEISQKIVAGKGSDGEKAVALQNFFHNNFEYHRGIRLEKRGMDPVKEFIIYRRAAHCEYFASAMVLMLRSSGIPARYVVGFNVHEYKRPADCYVVREKDAHAWVLAYVGGAWREFDPTPPGILEEPSRGLFDDWFDFVKMKFQIFGLYLKKGAVLKLFSEILSFLAILVKTPLFIGVICGIIILAMIYAGRKKLARFFAFSEKKYQGEAGGVENEEVKILRGLLANLDDFLVKKRRIERPKSLTLLEYGGFLEEKKFLDDETLAGVREFLRLYSEVRYSGVWREDKVNRMRECLSRLV